jgi:scyllo-inositol 2-dehydrogenase (NADP+)
MKQINVGLIGFGMAGRIFHAPTISCVEGLKLSKIRETKAPNSALIKERYPQTTIVSETKEILNDPNIDLVIVATPNVTHYEVAKQVLNAGKHAVIDKPITVTSAETDDLIALAKTKGKLLTTYQNRRWDSDFLTVKKLLASGLLGRLAEYESHYDRFRNTLRPDTWKEDGVLGTGIVYDLGSHLIDQAMVLFGIPKAVTAFLNKQREQTRIIDNFEIILHYDNLKATLKGGLLVKEPLPRYILLGNNGSFVKYGLDVQEEILNAGIFPGKIPIWGEEPEQIWGTINTEFNGVELRGKVKSENGNYIAFYQNVYKTLTGDEELVVKPEQARNMIRVIELAMKSNEEKRTLEFT